jgi:hypothetical protein
VLLLENESTLLGEIEKVGEEYRVRRTAGETVVPARLALRLCASVEDAYAFLRTRANLNDPDERRRLARWCADRGLHAQALAEAEAAAKLQPGHAPTARLVANLRDALRRKSQPPRPPAAPLAPGAELPVAVTADAVGQFANRVQPILMNACARCHASEKGGKFKLTRSYESGLANPRTLRRNLAAVLAQIDPHDPGASPLLLKANSVHGPGMSQAPLRGRKEAAFRALEDWARLTVANNPQLRQAVPARPGGAQTAEAPAPGSPHWGEDNLMRPVALPPLPPRPVRPVPGASALAQPLPMLPVRAPVGPADPDEFNSRYHPGRRPEGAPPPREGP